MKAGTCKHFTGLGPGMRDDKRCEAGVCIRAHVGGPDLGWCNRMPCHAVPIMKHADPAEVVPCERYEEPSAEEIAAYEADLALSIAKMEATFPLLERIKSEHAGESWEGVEVCPVCSGALRVTHSGINGHTWGNCETTDCLAWME